MRGQLKIAKMLKVKQFEKLKIFIFGCYIVRNTIDSRGFCDMWGYLKLD